MTLFVDVAVDFDGVLHTYDHWRDGVLYGEPIEGSVDALWEIVNSGREVAVFTARVDTQEQADAVVEWLDKHGYPPVPVTNTKPVAYVYLDDRAIRFEGDWADSLKEIGSCLEARRPMDDVPDLAPDEVR